GWTSPAVIGELTGGIVLLGLFTLIEFRSPAPMFRLQLFRIRSFTSGVLASFLAALGRGGLMFMLIIWLQGIWLPRHGFDFARTPLWAGIYMVPLTAGLLFAGPASGFLSDRFGSRPFATGGMVVSAGAFVALELLPINFVYWQFALVLLVAGLAMGIFGSPNRAGVMNSLPPQHRGAGSGMNSTFQNSAQVLSIGIFFSLMIAGLAADLPGALYHGLVAQGVPTTVAGRVAHLPPVSTLFAAFLGENPMQHLLGPAVLSHLSAAHQAALTGRSFFPSLISPPFQKGLHEAFDFAIAACLVAAGASWLRDGKYVYREAEVDAPVPATEPEPVGAGR
ncbi:MAG TPA: MFS transporter, partial [Acidimicrobiales bacterium]|nr:MFS transporter [Acidimicrobiales bacterium]